MYAYFFIYFVIVSLLQLRYYITWQNGRGEKAVFAYLFLGRIHLLLFFLPIIYHPSVSVVIKLLYTLFVLMGFAADLLLRFHFAKGCRTFRSSLRPNSRIIIPVNHRTDKPWNPFFKFISLVLILTGSSPFVTQQKNYLIIHDFLASAFRDEIAACPVYVYLYSKLIPFFLKRKSDFWKREADLYLIGLDKNANLSPRKLPFPAGKIRYLDENDLTSFPQCLVPVIEYDPVIRDKIENNFSPYKAYQGTEPGKQYLSQLICRLLEKRRTVTEYFYELMKLAEFIIHYRSLADYERSLQKYFNSGDPIAMGTFQEGIIDSVPCELPDKEAYILALKYLNQLCTGKEGSVNRKKLMLEGRQKLVMVRNQYIGHGTLSYGIRIDFVEHLLTAVAGQVTDFFHLPEPVMQQPSIQGIPKLRRQEGLLYLLVQLEKEGRCHYLDYGSGKSLKE